MPRLGQSAAIVMAEGSDQQTSLLNAKECSDEDAAVLRERLQCKLVPELRLLVKYLSIRLTGASRKTDIVDRVVAMCRLGCVRVSGAEEDVVEDCAVTGLPNVTEAVKAKLLTLPPFSAVDVWEKTIRGVITDFTFMNLLVYLVYGRDKTFDMNTMKAFKFFADGYVKNV